MPGRFQHAGQEGRERTNQRWWEEFGDPELNQVVKLTLENNLDLKKAAARILELDAVRIQTGASRWPNISLSAKGQTQYQTFETTIPGSISMDDQGRLSLSPSTTSSISQQSESYGLSWPVSFELDLWGKLARSDEAARADLLQAIENRRTTAQTTIASAVSYYFQIESLERRLQLTDKTIENYRRYVQLIEGRYDRGLADILTLRQTRRALAQAEASRPTLVMELAEAQRSLALLMGSYPRTKPPRDLEDEYFRLPDPPPPGLPAELLLRRPDVRAAEAGLKAANSRVGAAKAARFPSISLTGSHGYSSQELVKLLRPESELWNMALGITQPIFNAGSLKASQAAAGARYDQQVASYAQTVLTALAEVEKALYNEKLYVERRGLLLKYLEEARAAQAAAESRYDRGLTDYLNVLEAQQTRFSAEENLVLVELALLTNRVSLHRALGGGWAEESESE